MPTMPISVICEILIDFGFLFFVFVCDSIQKYKCIKIVIFDFKVRLIETKTNKLIEICLA